MTVCDVGADTDAQKNFRLNIHTSDLLVGLCEPSLYRSIETSNIVLQMCSIVYFVFVINGECLCSSNFQLR